MLAKNSEIVKSTASTIYKLSAEENIRLQCEARERYEHDTVSILHLGEKIGEKRGEKRGMEIGKVEATEQINQLNRLLLQDNRTDDLMKSTSDLTFQQELLKEYGLLSEILKRSEEKEKL